MTNVHGEGAVCPGELPEMVVGYAATRLPFGGLLSDLSGQGDGPAESSPSCAIGGGLWKWLMGRGVGVSTPMRSQYLISFDFVSQKLNLENIYLLSLFLSFFGTFFLSFSLSKKWSDHCNATVINDRLAAKRQVPAVKRTTWRLCMEQVVTWSYHVRVPSCRLKRQVRRRNAQQPPPSANRLTRQL
jgi:hypothetical protein